MTLKKLVDLIWMLAHAYKVYARARKIKNIRDARRETTKTGDTRILERELGGSSSDDPTGKYHGVYKRKREKGS